MIIATAGHVDHGKTLLVKALTGVDTDRLPEEKLRGLTIDLGFAYHHLNSDTVLGFVDVPGHERFIRNMLAGVSAIDFALLVVAADDGLMPQTREHLDILNLLGIDSGAVALSKTDLVDSARIQAVENEIADLLAATPLKNSPIFPVSVVNGNLGIQALSSHLEKTALKHRPRESPGEFRFSIDRCFTLRGAGLVVTGTVVSGTIQNGEQLILSPQGQPVRIRSIHAHDRKSTVAKVGQRCALNLTGKKLDKDIVGRGDWIIAPALHEPVSRLHARLRLLPGETNKLKSGTAVHVHLGASDVTGRVGILDQRTISPGQDAYVRLHLDHPVCALARDRLVLRDKSAKRTIGGGVVVDPFPQTRSANQKAMLKAMDVGSPAEVLVGMLPLSPGGINLDRFQRSWNLTVEELHALLEAQPVLYLKTIRYGLHCGTDTGKQHVKT
jgi:selenocysteine-specific elongation factor